MRHIVKSDEPQGFTKWKAANPEAEYENLSRHVKSWLKDSLISEQKGICCYCERRITKETSHIEHFKPKGAGKYPELQLEYSNLHASCGNNLAAGEETSCGHKKGNEYTDKLVSPLETDCHTHFHYLLDGTIHGTDERGTESISMLALDTQLLNKQRETLINYFLEIEDTDDRQQELKIHLDSSTPTLGEFYTMVETLF